MIDKYLCSVNGSDATIIVLHDSKADFWFLPPLTLKKKGYLVNHFKDLFELETQMDCTLDIVEHLGNG